MRPGPYERLVDDARLRRARPARATRPRRAASTWRRSPSPGCSRTRVDGAVCGPNRAEQLDPVLAARELAPRRRRHERIGGVLRMSVRDHRRARRAAAAADGRVHRGDGRGARVARARRGAQPAALRRAPARRAEPDGADARLPRRRDAALGAEDGRDRARRTPRAGSTRTRASSRSSTARPARRARS